jgi:hypothetical protein
VGKDRPTSKEKQGWVKMGEFNESKSKLVEFWIDLRFRNWCVVDGDGESLTVIILKNIKSAS